MQVILLQDVKGVGKRWELRDVADGYAMHVLLPKGLAATATKDLQEKAERERTQRAATHAESVAAAGASAKALEGLSVTVRARTNDTGELYAAVSPKQVAEALRAAGHKITAKAVSFATPIKKVGTHSAQIALGHGKTATCTLIVEADA
jgi:large subunit ribosomal protein L9